MEAATPSLFSRAQCPSSLLPPSSWPCSLSVACPVPRGHHLCTAPDTGPLPGWELSQTSVHQHAAGADGPRQPEDSCPDSRPTANVCQAQQRLGGRGVGGGPGGGELPKRRLRFCQQRLLCSRMPGQGRQLCQAGDWPPTTMFFPGFSRSHQLLSNSNHQEQAHIC